MIREGIRDALQLLMDCDPVVLDAAFRSVWVSMLAVSVAACLGVPLGVVLARTRLHGRDLVVLCFRVGMSVPTVLIGLVCFGLMSRRGALADGELLYTPWAIAAGEFLLALPIITTLTHGAMHRLDPRSFETAHTLGAGIFLRVFTYLNEARLAVMLAILTAFSRCFSELGIAMMVGGNIPGRTRTLATATALETSRGEFARGVAMCLILMLIALLLTTVMGWLSRNREDVVA